MRGLFTKIFLCFWIAQSLTIVISTGLILRHRFAWPEQFLDATSTGISGEAVSAISLYEQSGCPALLRYGAEIHQTIDLADAAQKPLCSPENSEAYAQLLAHPSKAADLQYAEAGNQVIWSRQIVSTSGKPYSFLLTRPRAQRQNSWLNDLWHFAFPQVFVAIIVFGASTFVLVLILTRPIGQLRMAAGDLAKGKLSARVPQSEGNIALFGVDEIQGLVHDFNYMAERLESAMGAQQILLRDVSHELRTPLTRLRVTLEMAREDAPPYMTDYLARIEDEAACVTTLIEQLLRLSSMESTNSLIRAESFRFDTLLDRIVANADFEARQRSCSVQIENAIDIAEDGSTGCVVDGVPSLIHQAVENIVRNAIRYTREGSVVMLHLRMEGPAGQQVVVLDVSDEGPGIPVHEMEKIFLPFYRVDGARQRDTGGFGVGLAIAERAIKLHHGTITAHNRAGSGLTVTIRVPAHRLIPTALAV